MILNRKVIESTVLTGMLVITAAVTATTGHVISTPEAGNTNQVSEEVKVVQNHGTAGIMTVMGENTQTALQSAEPDKNQTDTAIVASGQDLPEDTAGPVSGIAAVVPEEIVTGTTPETVAGTTGEATVAATAEAAQSDLTAAGTETPTEVVTGTETPADPAATGTEVTADTVTGTEVSVGSAATGTEVTADTVTGTETPADSAVAETGTQTAQTVTDPAAEWNTKLMADVEQYLNVRSAADENSDILGKLYVGDAADIVEAGDVWTHITSGSVDGYVKNEYCVMGAEAYAFAQEKCDTTATTLTGGLRLRSEPGAEASVIDVIAEGTELVVDKDAETTAEWVAVVYNGTDGYVSSEYVEVKLNVGTAVTIEEDRALQAKAAAEAAKTAQVSSSGVTQKGAVAASADEVTLLGALIQCEAGSESYEGQLAVGAVVMNRLRSGRYGGSVYSVVYAGGQFSPAGSGSVDRVIAGGVKGSCLQAAQEAINGADNTGGATSFRPAGSGHAGVVIGNHVFW